MRPGNSEIKDDYLLERKGKGSGVNPEGVRELSSGLQPLSEATFPNRGLQS